MNGNDLLVDTNIILYLLAGNESVANTLQGNRIFISFITEMELLGYSELSDGEADLMRELFSEFVIVEVDAEIKAKAIDFRRKNKLKLPDSIIAATAQNLDLPLFTADSDFEKVETLQLLLYQN